MTRPADLYIQFLHKVQGPSMAVPLPELDAIEEQILHTVALRQSTQERLCVRDLIGITRLGSPTRVFRRLQAMRTKGWLMLQDTSDNRRKQVTLTAAAMDHLDYLGGCMQRATGSVNDLLCGVSAAGIAPPRTAN
ncbi:winged helix-turn-helix domain-containing protein [Robbsia sp. KACC 23696]|uniref:winged helix-turn-helix domain-containing protein n=1 Tax=Robbsia sp. KACC 23696 TaxID=3149231 RepID=UPI00325A9C7F